MTNKTILACGLCILLVCNSLLPAQDVEYAEEYSPNGQYSAHWCVDGDILRMRIAAQTQGWLAIGFSDDQLMPNSDVIMLTGEGEVQDSFADRRSAPIPDDLQDVTLSRAIQEGDMSVVEFSRPISTADDEGDFNLDQDLFLLWAFNSNDDSFFSRHTRRGFSGERVNFQSAGACTIDNGFDYDFTGDGSVNVDDINSLLAQIGPGNDLRFDVNADGSVTSADISDYLEGAFNSYVGDSNLDGEFNSSDFVTVFTAGQYEDDIPMNSTWTEGDWNGDSEFSTTDLVFAFQERAFEQGPRPQQMAVVPEPSNLWIGMAIPLLCIPRRRGVFP